MAESEEIGRIHLLQGSDRFYCSHPKDGRRLDVLHWGLVLHFTKDLKACKRPINARQRR